MPTNSKFLQSAVKEVIAYTPPKLYTGKEWYVGFTAWDPSSNTMKRKKIKLNFIESKLERRKYASGLIIRLNTKLQNGWNPWIESENGRAFLTFSEICENYLRYITKLHQDGVYRKDTYVTNKSYLKNIVDYNNSRKKTKITYIYQFDTSFVSDLLEYVYVDRDNSAQTRNNYLGFVRTFSTFLVQNRYVKTKPSEGVPMISKRRIKKERTTIDDQDMMRLKDFLQTTNKFYLLSCYILHYCFIRPSEMSQLRIEDISVKNQTIYISEKISKNRTSGVITLPAKVIHLMIDIGIFNYPAHYYLFSDKFAPGEKLKSDKQFRDYWNNHVRKNLKFPARYKFYSLKDTGITNMLKVMDKLSVRDQARHSSILTTDIYTPHDLEVANELLKRHTGNF